MVTGEREESHKLYREETGLGLNRAHTSAKTKHQHLSTANSTLLSIELSLIRVISRAKNMDVEVRQDPGFIH